MMMICQCRLNWWKNTCEIRFIKWGSSIDHDSWTCYCIIYRCENLQRQKKGIKVVCCFCDWCWWEDAGAVLCKFGACSFVQKSGWLLFQQKRHCLLLAKSKTWKDTLQPEKNVLIVFLQRWRNLNLLIK